MVVHVRAFDWAVYTGRVMPAFAQWLLKKDEATIYQLFERTRCALEEQFLPDPMQRLRIWPRAKAFVDALPRGPHSRREYSKLCSTEQFTALSDRYLHNYTPHLHQDSAALRTIWGAIIEELCLPSFHLIYSEDGIEAVGSEQTVRGELVSLLQAAGLPELAQEVDEQATEVEKFDWEPGSADIGASEAKEAEEFDLYADEEHTDAAKPAGVMLGQHVNVLHLRGWLAGISVRAMALFEYLACGRRRMPFGYEAGEPFGGYVGYLTPDETWQLDQCLCDVKPPGQTEAEVDHLRFSQQQMPDRLVDEVLPTNADEFLQFVKGATLQGLGLICSVE